MKPISGPDLQTELDALELYESFLAFENSELKIYYNSKRTIISQRVKKLAPKKFIYTNTSQGLRVFRIE